MQAQIELVKFSVHICHPAHVFCRYLYHEHRWAIWQILKKKSYIHVYKPDNGCVACFNIDYMKVRTRKMYQITKTGHIWQFLIWSDVLVFFRLRGQPWYVQYIPRNMHTVFALLCFVVVIHWLIFPYPSGLLYWHCGNLTIAPMPAKQPWWIWINTSCEFILNDCIPTTKQSTTKPCAYFLGYTVQSVSDCTCDNRSIAPRGSSIVQRCPRHIFVCHADGKHWFWYVCRNGRQKGQTRQNYMIKDTFIMIIPELIKR